MWIIFLYTSHFFVIQSLKPRVSDSLLVRSILFLTTAIVNTTNLMFQPLIMYGCLQEDHNVQNKENNLLGNTKLLLNRLHKTQWKYEIVIYTCCRHICKDIHLAKSKRFNKTVCVCLLQVWIQQAFCSSPKKYKW